MVWQVHIDRSAILPIPNSANWENEAPLNDGSPLARVAVMLSACEHWRPLPYSHSVRSIPTHVIRQQKDGHYGKQHERN